MQLGINNIFSMGSENSKFIKDQQLPHEYRPLVQQPGVYQSVLSGNKILKHKIELNSQAQINYEKDVFVFRRMNADRLITAFFFQNFTPTHFCNMSYQVCFFTEYPCSNFALGSKINIQKTFHILIECLRGFELLFQKFGAFNVTSNNIFFNNHMEAKVWISSDLGMTKLEKARSRQSQMEMIKDIFRLFEKIKDERNYQINFSNFLKKIFEKEKVLTFKNVINYMVDEASKYFICRARKNQNSRTNENKTGLNQLLLPNNQLKDTKNQLISLKSRKRNYSKNSCSSTGYHFGSTQLEGSTIVKNFVDKSLKSKRHNSQEDCKTREINYFKSTGLDHYSNFHLNEHRRLQLLGGHQQSNTLRVNKKPLDQIDKNTRISEQFEESKTKRVGKNQQTLRENLNINVNINGKRVYQIVATQIDSQKLKGIKRKENFSKSPKQIQGYQPKQVIFEQVSIMEKNSQLFDPKVEHFISPIKEFGQSNMILSNLETLKSILHSQYSEMDSQIRNDLQNLDF